MTASAAAVDAKHSSEADQLLRTIVENCPIVLISFDADGRITLAEGTHLRTFRRADESLIGLPLSKLNSYSPIAAEAVRRGLLGESSDVELPLRGRHFDFRCRPVFNAAADVTGVLAVALDVTTRVQATAKLMRSEARWELLTDEALRQRDRMTRSLAAKATDIAMIVGVDGRVRYANPCSSSVVVAAEGDTLDFNSLNYVHPNDRAKVAESLSHLGAPGSTIRISYRRLGVAGDWLWVEQVVRNCVDDPDIRGLIVNVREITEQVEAVRALRASEARYRLIAETAQEGIWATDMGGRTMYANQRMADLLGHQLATFYERPAWELVTNTTRADFRERLRKRERFGTQRYDIAHTLPDGTERILGVVASSFVDRGLRMGSLAMVSDITKARADEAQLRHRATHDVLTGLANRSLLMERLQAALPGPGQTGSVAVLVADIDQFKLINDSFGHGSGDELLIAVSQRWEAALGEMGMLARIGGDEFAVLCLATDVRSAQATARKLLETFKVQIQIAGRQMAITASIGIAVATGLDNTDAEKLLRYADIAMYEAKEKGRNRTVVFTPALVERAQKQLRLYNDLKGALDQDRLILHYQPVVDLSSGEMLGVEALCRWTDPSRGSVSPETFIPLAERAGLIEPLDRWVLKRACQDAAAMRAAGILAPDAYVAINISAGSLAEPGLQDAVCRALQETQLPAGTLVLEVTESGVMTDPDAANVILAGLRELGVRVAIDDFGTGYSSLGYLRRFPVSALKIDRSFIQHMSEDPDDLAIVTAVINLAETLNLATTAEGIETETELALVQQLGCRAGQGFLWSPALPPNELAVLLDQLPGHRFKVQPTGRKQVFRWT